MSDKYSPTSHSIQSRDLQLHYLDWGNEDGLPILFLHGLSGAAGEWQRVAEHFQSDYHPIALDQRGHGESEHAPERSYTTDHFVADLEDLVDELGLKRFILCGHSMGGHNTLAYASRHPEQVICALVNDIPPAWKINPVETAKQFHNGQQPMFSSIEEFIDLRRDQNLFTPEEFHQLSARARLRKVLEIGSGHDLGYQAKSDPNASIFWTPADLWEEVAAIKSPILIIRAAQASVLDASTLERMKMTIKDARTVTLEQSGHNTFFDNEQEFLNAATQFFAENGN